MTVIASPEFELLPPRERLCAYALQTHRLFEEEFVKHPQHGYEIDGVLSFPSYHNKNHIQAVIDSGKIALQYADLFHLNRDFAQFAQQRGFEHISFDDLDEAVEVAFACHDLGNILVSDVVEIDAGQPGMSVQFTPTYIVPDASGRCESVSARVADKLIAKFYTDKSEGFRREFSQLVQHLIMQTVFDIDTPNHAVPFWEFVQLMDQISSAYFSTQTPEQNAAGLLNERRIAGEEPRFTIDAMMSFVQWRLDQLVSDADRRAQMLEVFGQNPRGVKEVDLVQGARFAAHGEKVIFDKHIPLLWNIRYN